MPDPNAPIDLGFNPYESPKATSPLGPMQFRPTASYRSGHLRAMCAVALLTFMIVLALAKVYCDYDQYQILSNAKIGVFNPVEGRASDARFNTVAVTSIVMYFACSVPFLMWVYRGYQNLPALGAQHLEHTPGMAVGWWFVPIANLVKPYTVVAEVWQNSDPAGIGQFARRSSAGLVGLWWGVFITRNIGATVVSRLYATAIHERNINDIMTYTAADGFIHTVSLAAAVLAILVVLRIDGMQDARFDALQNQIPVAEVV